MSLRFQCKILEAIADPPGRSEKGAPMLRNKDVNKESAKRADTWDVGWWWKCEEETREGKCCKALFMLFLEVRMRDS